MRVRPSLLPWLGLSISMAMLACGSSADVSDNSGDDSGTGSDTSSAGDSRVTTDSKSDTTTSGDSSKDGNADTKTSDTSSSDTTSSGDSTSSDTGSGGTDSSTGVDVPVVDVVGIDGIASDASCAGIECAGFPSTFITGCSVDDNCVGEMHQVDCCGAMRVIGMNHSESTTFCAAEFGAAAGTGCRSEYPSPAGCSSDLITADDGATTTDPTKVAVHCVAPSTGGGTCKTFVCGTAGGTPCPTSRRIGTCGP